MNRAHIGYVVTVDGRGWVMSEHGDRAGDRQVAVDGPYPPPMARSILDDRLRVLRTRDGYVWTYRGVKLTVEVPPSRQLGSRLPLSPDSVARAYRQYVHSRFRATVDLIARAPEIPGPRRLLALTRFDVEARSEPVAQALAAIADRVPTYIADNGPAVFVVASPVASQVLRCYGPHAAVAYGNLGPERVSRQVLETVAVLWEPDGDGAFAFIDDAWDAACELSPTPPCPVSV